VDSVRATGATVTTLSEADHFLHTRRADDVVNPLTSTWSRD
jgi:hypothetical protein